MGVWNIYCDNVTQVLFFIERIILLSLHFPFHNNYSICQSLFCLGILSMYFQSWHFLQTSNAKIPQHEQQQSKNSQEGRPSLQARTEVREGNYQGSTWCPAGVPTCTWVRAQRVWRRSKQYADYSKTSTDCAERAGAIWWRPSWARVWWTKRLVWGGDPSLNSATKLIARVGRASFGYSTCLIQGVMLWRHKRQCKTNGPVYYVQSPHFQWPALRLLMTFLFTLRWHPLWTNASSRWRTRKATILQKYLSWC